MRAVLITIRIDDSARRMPQQFDIGNLQTRLNQMIRPLNATLVQDQLAINVARSTSTNDLGLVWSRKTALGGLWTCKDKIIAYNAYIKIRLGVSRNLNGIGLANANRDEHTVELWPDNLATIQINENNDLWANVVAHEVLFHTLLDMPEGHYNENDVRNSVASNRRRSLAVHHIDGIKIALDLK